VTPNEGQSGRLVSFYRLLFTVIVYRWQKGKNMQNREMQEPGRMARAS